ncbi:MAG: GyrI-like domain-containing protein [Methanocorpusculum sp.]|nr:GyrI-like domain-containing protein [Methanocorpusculum sp.]MDE2522865.1 GyrI-like domain-containing protein [Methanocorpusculum sp.]MDE2523590.1 GyrI-like domain-containing protein [Methanocorpusculum sp.]
MNYTAEVKYLPAYLVYYKQGIVPSLADIPEFVLRAAAECREKNPDLRCVEPGYCYTAYPEVCSEKNVFIEYGEAVEAAGYDTETIRFKELESVSAVCVLHRGDYTNLGEAYRFALAWAAEHGYEVSAPPREQYIHGVWDREQSEEWLTEVQIPVRKR